MNIKILQSRFRIKHGNLVSSLDGRRVGSHRGKTHKVMIDGIYYRTEEILAILSNHINNPEAINITMDGDYETAMGNPVELLRDDGPITAPFIGVVRIDGAWHACMWTLSGVAHNENFNLVEKQQ